MNNLSSNKIGVFDSGIGGMTVLKELALKFGSCQFVYIGDSAYFPYGELDSSTLNKRVLKFCEYFASIKCCVVVIACNTATSICFNTASKYLKQFNIPVVGVIEPGAHAAVGASINKNIGVLATNVTVNSHAYKHAIQKLDNKLNVYEVAAPYLVKLAENKISNTNCTLDTLKYNNEIVKNYCQELIKYNVDTVLLGCTHFPLIVDLLKDQFSKDITFVSSAYETAKSLKNILFSKRCVSCNNQSQNNIELNLNRFEIFTTHDIKNNRYKFKSVFKLLFDTEDVDVNLLSI